MKSAMTSILNYDLYTVEQMKDDPNAVLDRIVEKQTGGVIKSETGKHVAMLPASLVSITEGEDFRLVLYAATEYDMGRHTYMPSVVSRFVSRHMRLLDEQTTTLLIEAIKRHMETYGTHEPYPSLWNDLKEKLEQRLEEIEGGNR